MEKGVCGVYEFGEGVGGGVIGCFIHMGGADVVIGISRWLRGFRHKLKSEGKVGLLDEWCAG